MWIIKIIKIKCFNPPRILGEHWCIYSCLQTPPRENWFQYVRRVCATAINFSCISTLYTPIFLTCCLFVYIPIYLSATQYLAYLVYLSIFLSDFLNLINSSRPNFSIFSHCTACTMKDGCSKGDHTKKLLKIIFYQIDFWTVQNCRVFFLISLIQLL